MFPANTSSMPFSAKWRWMLFIYLLIEFINQHRSTGEQWWEYKIKMRKYWPIEWPTQEHNRRYEANATKYRSTTEYKIKSYIWHKKHIVSILLVLSYRVNQESDGWSGGRRDEISYSIIVPMNTGVSVSLSWSHDTRHQLYSAHSDAWPADFTATAWLLLA